MRRLLRLLVVPVAIHAGPLCALAEDIDRVETGRDLYGRECNHCHFGIENETSGRMAPIPVMMVVWGPPLRGIVGRPAAAVSAFLYSESFLEATRGIIWDEANLDRMIEDTQAAIPGSFMIYRQPDAAKRQAIIAYLKTAG